MNKIQEIVNDPEWQNLRSSFVGTWKITPVENCKKLREYLQDFSDWKRMLRVINYLTGSGFRIGIISHPEINKLLNDVKALYYERIY